MKSWQQAFLAAAMISSRQAHDEVVATGFLGCGDDFLLRRVGFAETDVVAYRVLKQVNILKYHGYVAHQAFGICFIHRNIVEEDTPFLWVVEAGAKFHQRTFPASRRTDKSRQ